MIGTAKTNKMSNNKNARDTVVRYAVRDKMYHAGEYLWKIISTVCFLVGLICIVTIACMPKLHTN
jgi:hypothetical protein